MRINPAVAGSAQGSAAGGGLCLQLEGGRPPVPPGRNWGAPRSQGARCAGSSSADVLFLSSSADPVISPSRCWATQETPAPSARRRSLLGSLRALPVRVCGGQEGQPAAVGVKDVLHSSLVGTEVTRTLQLQEGQRGREIRALRCLYLCPQDFGAASPICSCNNSSSPKSHPAPPCASPAVQPRSPAPSPSWLCRHPLGQQVC